MAQRIASVLVVGNVVKSQRKAGTMAAPEDPSRQIDWDYIEARLLTPEFDTLDVRFPSDKSIPVPHADEQVTLRVEARATSQGLRLTVTEVVASAEALV